MSYYYVITLLCWIIGGWFGLHHFYLGRDGHGFLWATSFGGFFFGWIREISKLKGYTDDANKEYPLGRSTSICKNFTRVFGMFLFGIFYRRLFLNSIPDELPSLMYTVLVLLVAPLGTALALYMISNIGHIECPGKYPLIGAYIGELLFGYVHILFGDINTPLLVVVAIIPTVWYWKERRKRKRRSYCRRLAVWGGLWLLFCCLWSSYVYFNFEIYVEELDQDVKLRVILKDLFDSPEWKQFMQELWNLFYTLWDSGGDYEKTWYLFQEGVATTRILKSLETLELDPKMNIDVELTETALTKQYRELSRKWHPDKHPSSEKNHAQEMFIEIQEAYETLKKVIKRKLNRKTEL